VVGRPTTFTVSTDAVLAQVMSVSVCHGQTNCTTLTPANEQPIAAGPATATFTYTPQRFGTYTINVETDYGASSFDTEATGTANARFALGAPSLVAPASGSIGPQFNPAFTWQGTANEVFSLVIWQPNGGALGGFLQIQPTGYVTYSGSPGSDPGLAPASDLSRLSDFATFSASSTGDGRVHMNWPLPPGRYAWAVVAASADHPYASSVRSATRYFTVQGPTLTHLRTDSAAHHEAVYKHPGYTLLKVHSTPYTTLKVVYSIGRRATTRTMYYVTARSLTFRWTGVARRLPRAFATR
jgi:hypothetical protein